ncbi:MAG: ATP-binding cassette domain-containing protein [Flavobacteriaceae bacterium]|nr:ATP-binding cassette domain-containing protein [Flavobacteriaceae bacterium]
MNPNKLSPWQRFVGILQLERRDILQVFYYAIFSGLVALTLPLGIQAIINLIQGAQISTSWIVLVILVTVGVAFAGLLQLMQLRIIETIQQRIFTRASFEFTYRFPKIKASQMRNLYPPELANRFFDTLSIQKGLSKILVDVPAAGLQVIFALLLLSFYHPFFIIFGILLLLLIYLVFRFTAKKGMQTSLTESQNKYKVAHWIQEVARAMVSFKLSGKTNLAMSKNDQLVSDYLVARESHFKILMIQFAQMIGFKVIVTAGLLIIGGALVLSQEMNIGQFVAAEIIIILVINSVEKLILGLESFYDVLTSLEKLGQVVDKELEPLDGEQPVLKDEFVIELKDLEYRVPGRDGSILSNIDLKISSRNKILLRGESGSGKSSLLRLIAGVIEPTKGRIFVDGRALESIQLNHYRSQIGLSLSEETPFEGTIRENITFGDPNINDDDVYWAMDQVGLGKFVKEQSNGLNTFLYPEGKQISYSISKKIILARAIVKRPKLLILEDSLNQFEKTETDYIMNALTGDDKPWTLIVVSMNDRWSNFCSQSITLNEGKILNA